MLLTIWTTSVPLSWGQVYEGEIGVVVARLVVLDGTVELTVPAGEATVVEEIEVMVDPEAAAETVDEPLTVTT